MHMIVHAVLPGETVFDVGANLGDKAQWFVDRGARVIAVEPQPKLIDHLKLRFSDNQLVTIVSKGLAEQAGELTMSISDNHVLSTFSEDWKIGRFKNEKWNEHVRVPVTTLDELINEFGHPRYVKVDVEGYEKQVIDGLNQKTGVISFEFTAEYIERAADICSKLRSIGYRHFNIGLGERTDFAFPAKWPTSEEVLKILRVLSEREPLLWGDIYAV
jgi:FkbM family methyltransferase